MANHDFLENVWNNIKINLIHLLKYLYKTCRICNILASVWCWRWLEVTFPETSTIFSKWHLKIPSIWRIYIYGLRNILKRGSPGAPFSGKGRPRAPLSSESSPNRIYIRHIEGVLRSHFEKIMEILENATWKTFNMAYIYTDSQCFEKYIGLRQCIFQNIDLRPMYGAKHCESVYIYAILKVFLGHILKK